MFGADTRWLAHYGFSAFADAQSGGGPELGARHEIHPLLAQGTSRNRRHGRRGRRGHDHGRARGRACGGPGDEAGGLLPWRGSSRPFSTPTPTACGSARWTPSTAARRSSAARPTRGPAWSPSMRPSGPIIPGTGITLEPRAVRGVVSNGMLCSAAELQTAEESDGILELTDDLAVGSPAAAGAGPGSGDRFRGDAQPARLAGRGRHRPRPGRRRDRASEGPGRSRPSRAPSPARSTSASTAPQACPAFAGRLIRGVKNGPSPAWLQAAAEGRGPSPDQRPGRRHQPHLPTTAPGRCTSMTRP